MRFMIHAALGLALALPAGIAAQERPDAPACRASLDGDRLTTTIEFPDGYMVQGPWQVLENQPASLDDGRTGVRLSLRLDAIVEVEPGSDNRVTTPLPKPIETSFEGESEEELVYRAARVWCTAILRAQRDAGRQGTRHPVIHTAAWFR